MDLRELSYIDIDSVSCFFGISDCFKKWTISTRLAFPATWRTSTTLDTLHINFVEAVEIRKKRIRLSFTYYVHARHLDEEERGAYSIKDLSELSCIYIDNVSHFFGISECFIKWTMSSWIAFLAAWRTWTTVDTLQIISGEAVEMRRMRPSFTYHVHARHLLKEEKGT